MNTHIAWFLASLIMTLSPLSGASRDAQWKEVDHAIAQGLPRTALEKLDPIVADAINARAWGEAAKAVATRVTLQARIEGSRAEEHIVRMEDEMARAPVEIVPLLKTLQAHWYWQYFQQNHWRIMQRTATEEAPGEDFTTWDLSRLFAEIDRRFQSALENAEQLQQTPIEMFDEFLIRGTQPDRYRPTLYDFIAHEALSFYTSGEQAGAKPQDAFVLSADSPIFDPVNQFLDWAPDSPGDADSPILRSIKLYQDLLRFHRPDTDPTAFIDVDLARIVFGHNMATGENKGERYVTALDRLVQDWADHEVAAMALSHWAEYHRGEQQPTKAHQLASRGRDTHPDSPGGRACWNLIQQIEAPWISIITERVWTQPLADIQVHYQNLTNLHLRIVPWDWAENLAMLNPRGRDRWDEHRKEMLSRQPALEWSAALPPTADFVVRSEEIPAPDSLAPGHYYLLTSTDPEFGATDDNQVSFAPFWVSDLALIVRSHNAALEGFVLEADSGEPIAGAEVTAWQEDRQGNRIQHGPFPTDELGFYRAPIRPQFGYLVHVRHDGQELATWENVHPQLERKPQAQNRTMFFTDRALYRPGQTIQYKAICLRIDTNQDDYQALSGQSVVVVLRDSNGREITRAQHRGNDYGSFSGSFTAPRDGVLGQMTLQAIEGPPGASHVQVEEYKRPQFRVTLEPPRTAPRLNDAVLVTGNAESYTGAPVDGAEVRYRVVREVRWPYWRHWFSARRWPTVEESQEIGHGTANTDTGGNFTVEFHALPDPKVSEDDGISFVYTVYADVTNGAGETRSAQRAVNVGFVALSVTLHADEWQTSDQPVELTVRTTTLDDEPQAAEGTVRVHRLIPPNQVHRAQMEHRYWPWGSPPIEDDTDPSDPNHWELGQIEWEGGFSTDATGVVTLECPLPTGAYRVLLDGQDRFGRSVTALMPLQVLDPTADQLAIKVPHLLAAPAWSIEPGDEFLALWGTGYETGRAFIEIEHRGEMIRRFWTPADQTQAQVRSAVTEEMRGGFTLHVTFVRENRAYLESRKVEVPWTNQELDIRWEHFRSKLGPADQETWSAVIARKRGAMERDKKDEGSNGPAAELAVAEMVATLYDASLDAFLPHQWIRRFDFFRQDYSRRRSLFGNGNLPLQHLHGQWALEFIDSTFTYRSFPPELVWDPRGQMMYSRSGIPSRGMAFGGGARHLEMSLAAAMAPMAAPASAGMEMERFADAASMGDKLGGESVTPTGAPAPDLSQVTARRNLQETAFFFPQLLSDSNGVVRMSFTMPEALTTWRFMGFAHDAQLRSGYLEEQTITAKDLMVRPNPPRFLREGDELEFTVQVLNQSPARQTGRVQLTFQEAFADTSVDEALDNMTPELEFDIPSKESRAYSWRIRVPDGMGFLTYKAVAATARLSDGEEGYLPVLSRRILVTESLPLPIRGPATNHFQFEKLLMSEQSDTLQHQNLVVQMVSNPAWYAVLALPYLMEFPHECTEQTFNRLYANALARFIANSDPRIRRVFDQWKNTPALDSPLEKNADLKAVAIEETPWLRQAQSESQARRNVGILFDSNRLDYETDRLLQRMAELQLPDGSPGPGSPAVVPTTSSRSTSPRGLDGCGTWAPKWMSVPRFVR
jgi:hypothetical protein